MGSQRHDLKKNVEKLDAEPLTHLMLGHRELCHSNLLAWFFQYLKAESDDVFGRLTKSNNTENDEIRKVQREENKRDLRLYWPNRRPVVIEIKVFSLPEKAQLEKYTSNNPSNAFLWLLSLSNPIWKDDRVEINHHEWRWLSFQELAKLIRSALPADNASYEVETMRRYAKVIDLLHELAAAGAVMDSNETVRLPDDVKIALGDSRLISSIAKLRASSVAQCVRKALCEAGVSQTTVEAGYTGEQPYIEWFRPLNDEWQAGWQLQNGHFRLAIRVNKNNETMKERTQRENFAKKKPYGVL